MRFLGDMARVITPLFSQRWPALIIDGTPHSLHTSISYTVFSFD
jgi:hypothetical protein